MPAIPLAKAPQPSATNPAQIRNFCIIAHIDHGKSTLADRMLGITGVAPSRAKPYDCHGNLELMVRNISST